MFSLFLTFLPLGVLCSEWVHLDDSELSDGLASGEWDRRPPGSYATPSQLGRAEDLGPYTGLTELLRPATRVVLIILCKYIHTRVNVHLTSLLMSVTSL